MGAPVESFIRQDAWAYQKRMLKSNAYVAGSQYDYIWTDAQKKLFKQLWKENRGLVYMCDKLDRHWVEVTVLASDLLEKGHIRQRERPLFG